MRFKKLTPAQAYKAVIAGEAVWYRRKDSDPSSWDMILGLHENEDVHAWFTEYDFKKVVQEDRPLLHKDLPFGTWLQRKDGSYARYGGVTQGESRLVIFENYERKAILGYYGETGETLVGSASKVVKVLPCAPIDAPECLK